MRRYCFRSVTMDHRPKESYAHPSKLFVAGSTRATMMPREGVRGNVATIVKVRSKGLHDAGVTRDMPVIIFGEDANA